MTRERSEIEARILHWMTEPWAEDEGRFDRLARRLFAWQYDHGEVYRRFCRTRGRTPERVKSWRDIPAVPTGAFKEIALRCFPETATCKTFRTSGTALERRGELHLDTLALYEASLVPSFERHLLPDRTAAERVRLVVLAPSPADAPDSSLSHMFGVLLERRGDPGSFFAVRNEQLDLPRLLPALEAADAPLVLCGTAFAVVHLVDALAETDRRIVLPPGSRVMETGGFKGRARSLERDALYAAIEQRLGVSPGRCVNQYGMTELGSQFHDSVLVAPDAGRRKLAPPWTRVRIVDPLSGDERAPGETGAIEIVDLANTGSVLAVRTADLGRSVPATSRVGAGFEVLGREPGAEARGCSLAADAMLKDPSR